MYWSLFTHVILLLLFLMISRSQSSKRTTIVSGNESDRLALLSFKERITQDPFQVMNSWNNSIHFCQWVGVSCNSSDERVVGLNLKGHKLVGSVPPSIGNLTFLTRLSLSDNNFHGEVPQEISLLLRLRFLNLTYNSFTGQIPANLTHCSNLRVLSLGLNNMVGSIPKQLSSLTKLVYLELEKNNLTGRIPPWLGNFSSLLELTLLDNNFEGAIPDELGQRSLGFFQVSLNKLSGIIPDELGNCVHLTYLYLDGNSFEGIIPRSLNALVGLQELDLSSNELTGQIPEYLGSIHFLYKLNLSFNDFDGKVPQQGVFLNVSALSLIGNSKICGGIPSLRLPVCVVQPALGRKKHPKSINLRLITLLITVAMILCLITCYFVITRSRSRKKPTSEASFDHQYLRVSYVELVKATDGFSSENLIGVGSYGSVYKGVLRGDGSTERFVAVKVLNLQQQGASKSFMAECNSLRNIRHRNLIKILSVCSSVDSRGNDFKALVFYFMANGSLENWLHPDPETNLEVQPRHFDLLRRLNAAIDVASALDYLHHQCETPIVHRDLKPSNILLDFDMTAHVGDFGLAKFLSTTISTSFSQNPTSSSSAAIKGSIGYVAPEYGMGGEASIEGDVYSFGIVLLEMFTGKRPTEEMFKEDLNLHSFSKLVMSSEGRSLQMIDQRLLIDIQERINRDGIRAGKLKLCLNSVLKIGVACSVETSAERMNMVDVVMELCAIREVFLRIGIHGDRQSGPT